MRRRRATTMHRSALSPPGVFAAAPTPSGKERKSSASSSSSCSPLASTLLRRSPGLDHPAVDSLTVLYATPLCLKEARSALSEAARASPVCTELRTRRFLPVPLPSPFPVALDAPGRPSLRGPLYEANSLTNLSPALPAKTILLKRRETAGNDAALRASNC